MQFLGVADQPIQGKPLEPSSQNVADPRFIYPDLFGDLLLQKPVLSLVLRDELAERYFARSTSVALAGGAIVLWTSQRAGCC